jgi:hypothetical protein
MKRNRTLYMKEFRAKRRELGLCTNCGSPKDRDGIRCSKCNKNNTKKISEWKKSHPKRVKEIRKKSYIKNQAKILLHAHNYLRKFWLSVITHYGGNPPKCACCGETILKFLTIDHMYKNGRKERKELKRWGLPFYQWLVQNNFPEGYQVLCFNCNCGRAINKGICPHKEGIIDEK